MEDRPRSDRVKPTTPHADWQRNGPRKSEVETDLFVGVELDWGCGLDWGQEIGGGTQGIASCDFAVAPNNERNGGAERKRERKRQSEGERKK